MNLENHGGVRLRPSNVIKRDLTMNCDRIVRENIVVILKNPKMVLLSIYGSLILFVTTYCINYLSTFETVHFKSNKKRKSYIVLPQLGLYSISK